MQVREKNIKLSLFTNNKIVCIEKSFKNLPNKIPQTNKYVQKGHYTKLVCITLLNNNQNETFKNTIYKKKVLENVKCVGKNPIKYLKELTEC